MEQVADAEPLLRRWTIISGMWTIFPLIFLTIAAGIAAWLAFLWSVKRGQYDDPERPKYRMLDDEEEKKKQ